MADTPFRFAEKLIEYKDALKAVPRIATSAACLEAKGIILAELNAVAPGGRLRGAGKNGAKLGVSYTVTPAGADSAVGTLNATGPWQLIEGPTAAHEIPRKSAQRKGHVVSVPGLGVFSHVFRGPTSGKHPWEHSKALVAAAAPKRYEEACNAAMLAVFH